MKTKHTKGTLGKAWEVPDRATSPDKVIVHAHPRRIALCYNEKGKYPELYPSREEAEANAKLIAMAPELLQLCFEAYQFLFDTRQETDLCNRLCRATQKANGEKVVDQSA